ncbi:pyridoxal phosphate-dependent aminotransferase [Hydrogenothermus marinus]|uniref:Aspartate/methionine/tyrosine aminotransferase n=1 Tax=Hydrogenothermus marinus TaxID=133270 RepID=A0A3M0BNM2_9AQUI|nr:aminotransferase class I/II-fold pyridoxal phosphate-dependent enzyme [Hydrogenothermus marinus]RMA97889.1 aspartate/methionine/tyrosine aminotransferase [Hydrogenothermus marinus]
MDRLAKVSPFIVMDIVREAQKYKDTIHFEIGEPDLQPSPKVWQLAEKAVKDKLNFYTESVGLLELREKIAEHYYNKYKVNISPSRIVLTVGTSGAFLTVYSILLNQGEKLAFPDPSYPCYKNFSYILDVEPVLISVDKSTNYQLTSNHLREYKDIKAIQISSPNNPTGNIYKKEVLEDLINYCEERDIYFISDEIYHGLVYDEKEHTALEFSDNAIVINGFSKYFCMPGFRLGWMILPENLIRKAEIVMQNLFISPPTISQFSALGAFDYEYLDKITKEYRKRRDFLYEQLKDIFDIDAKPEGAFYIWANIEKYSDNSYEFVKKILEKTHVAITPGIDFGKNNTEKYIRFAYTKDIKHMEEGIKRLKEFLKNEH